MIVGGIINLLGQAIGMFGAKGKAKQDALAVRVSGMGRSWTDEFIALYWFGPSFVGFWSPEASIAIQSAMFNNKELVGIQVGITMAVFGLGKLNGRKA
jgi:hypothetical protein